MLTLIPMSSNSLALVSQVKVPLTIHLLTLRLALMLRDGVFGQKIRMLMQVIRMLVQIISNEKILLTILMGLSWN